MSVAILAINGLYLLTFAKKFNITLKWMEWFGLSCVTAMGNYLTPFSGGLVARAAYLKARHEFPYARFLSMLTANYLIAFAVIGFTGIAVLLTLGGTGRYSWLLTLLFAVILLTIPLLLVLPLRPGGSDHRVMKFLCAALDGLNAIRRDGALLGKLVALTFLNVALGALLYFAAFHSIGSAVSFRIALLIYLLTACTVLINLTPGNLGVQEAAASVGAAALGAGAGEGLVAALIIRAVTVLTAFVLGPIFSYLLSRELIAAREVEQSGRTG
jgi:uncharacterized membrane protein YbhN (UPF0104 family)